MYKVTKRDCPMFGIGPYVCEFICDTASDISTLPTSISEGTGGKTVYDNQKCASGSIANVAENGAESKQYILNNQNIWCPYSVAVGSNTPSSGESSVTVDFALSNTSENPVANKTITAALNEKADTTHTHTANEVGADASGSAASALVEAKAYTDSEIADAMAENQTVVEALDAAIGTKANKTDIPTELPANGGTADTSRQVISTSSKVRLWEDNEGGNLELVAPDGVHSMQMDLFNNASFRMYFDGGDGLVFPLTYDFATKKLSINGHTVDADVPADVDFSAYALKSKYGDTTIDVGRKTDTTVGERSTAEGYNTTASGNFSHAEGSNATASGISSHAEGSNLDVYSEEMSNITVTISDVDYTISGSTAYGINSHAEGTQSFAYGYSSHAEGYKTTASGISSHAEGYKTTASGNFSHAEGYSTTASGGYSHTEGYDTTASGNHSHAGGTGTKALHDNEVAYGSYNESNDDTLFSIGDGIADDARHNAFEITKTGGMLHDKDILISAHCIQFIPYNMKYYAQNDRILLFANDDTVARGIYFVNNTSNDIVVCALLSASAAGPIVQYGYGTSPYPDIQNIGGDGREWFVGASIQTSPTIYSMTVPSGKLGYYGLYRNSESAYAIVHDIRCPYFNYF